MSKLEFFLTHKPGKKRLLSDCEALSLGIGSYGKEIDQRVSHIKGVPQGLLCGNSTLK